MPSLTEAIPLKIFTAGSRKKDELVDRKHGKIMFKSLLQLICIYIYIYMVCIHTK